MEQSLLYSRGQNTTTTRQLEFQMNVSKSNYWRFAAMILVAMGLMYGLTYLNSYQFSHVQFSETRSYMTLIMGASMAIVMLAFMSRHYQDRRVNMAIYLGSAAVAGLALWLMRSQQTVDDESWMRAMIPHHSIAILTSERAQIEDARVRDLADDIIKAQRREIKEMEWLIEDIDRNGVAGDDEAAASRPVPDFTGRLSAQAAN